MSGLWALPLAIAMVVSALLVRQFLVPSSRLHILDHPNERSLHEKPTPRTGGVGLVTGFAVGMATMIAIEPASVGDVLALLAVAIGLGVVSFMDDRFEVSIRFRLVAHFAAAAVLVFLGYRIDAVNVPGFEWPLGTAMSLTLSAIYIVWMINLYNFMDGMDGFAGGMTVVGFGALAMLGAVKGAGVFSLMAGTISVAAVGFLFFNFPPAQIFLGDTGSSVLGLLAAAMSLWADRADLIPLWISILIFSPFVFDATFTLIRRLLRGERVWVAHRTHLYQRLVRAGWSHRKTVLMEYGLMCGCAASAMLAMSGPSSLQWIVAFGWSAIYVGIAFAVARLERATAVAGD